MDDVTSTQDGVTVPSPEDVAMARESSRKLARALHDNPTLSARFGRESNETVELPTSAARLLLDILERMAGGKAVVLMPVQAELTTQQAADLLDVSRTHLVRLLDEGAIPYRKVGTHRRVEADDVLRYRRETERKRRQALDELTAYDQELGFQ